MDTNYIAKHIICNEQEKLQCMKTVNQLLYLADTARKMGILALETEAAKMEVINQAEDYPKLLKIGIDLIVDGTDPEIVEDILENYILASCFDNCSFLQNFLVYKGVLAIQQGENPICIQEKLCSCFGLYFREKFLDNCNYSFHNQIFLELLLQQYKEKLDSFEKTKKLDSFISHLDNRNIQRIIREILGKQDMYTLEWALVGTSQDILEKFLNNFSKKLQTIFFYDINNIRHLYKEDIIKAQDILIDFIKQLEQTGEIILSVNHL